MSVSLLGSWQEQMGIRRRPTPRKVSRQLLNQLLLKMQHDSYI